MAITASQIQFRSATGAVIVSGKLNNVFANVLTTSGTTYTWVEVDNLNLTLTLTSVKAWLTADPRGATLGIAYDSASGVLSTGVAWDVVDPASLTYSSPTTMATGITLGNMGPSQKCRIFLRRLMSGATVAVPENNRIWVGGSSPL